MIFKIVHFRSGCSLEALLTPILAHFEEVLALKMTPKVAQKVTRNWTQKYTKKVPFLVPKMEGTIFQVASKKLSR
jgi:hypothetical protein